MSIINVLPLKEIASIKHLWLQNAAYHSRLALEFNRPPAEGVFETRVAAWNRAEHFFASAACSDGEITGYCISTISGTVGTIESLYISSDFRRQGIGRELMRSHLAWFKENSCPRISVSTVFDNGDAMAFYRSIGFLPRTVTLELKR